MVVKQPGEPLRQNLSTPPNSLYKSLQHGGLNSASLTPSGKLFSAKSPGSKTWVTHLGKRVASKSTVPASKPAHAAAAQQNSDTPASGAQPDGHVPIPAKPVLTMPFVLPPCMPPPCDLKRPSRPVDMKEQLQLLKKLREAAVLPPPQSTGAPDEPAISSSSQDSASPPLTPLTPARALFSTSFRAGDADRGEAAGAAATAPEGRPLSPRPAVAQLLLDSLQPLGVGVAGAVQPPKGHARNRPDGPHEQQRGLSRLRTLDHLQRLRQLQKEGSRMVTLLS